MPMKLFSAEGRISPARARNATLFNLLATPGLGSLLARRWRAGIGQLLLALAGCGLGLVWFVLEMTDYYGQIVSDHPQTTATPLTLLWRGVILFALAWGWSLVTSLSLLAEARRNTRAAFEGFAPGQPKMSEPQIAAALAAAPDWRSAGAAITRTYAFKDFVAAMKFVNAVASLAEAAQHHPDVDIRWNRVTLALTTHDAGGLTGKDFALARQCDVLSLR